MSNEIMMQGFEWYLPDEGTYFRNLASMAKELKSKGIDAIWLPPFYKATGTQDVGYGVYDLYDLGEFDQKGSRRTKYGTKEELLAAIHALQEAGIRVYADVVLNHKAGADDMEECEAVMVDREDRNRVVSEPRKIQAWTHFHFPGRQGKYSDFQWHWEHFNGVDYDAATDTQAIFRILGEHKTWQQDVSKEKGNYDYLMFADVDHDHPQVRQSLFAWIRWLVDETGIDGIRLDALKHISASFIKDFIAHVRSFVSEDFYFFGEYWQADETLSKRYLYSTEFETDLFDVGLHFNFHEASTAGDTYDLRRIFEGSLVEEHPTLSVTFVDNHDSQQGQALESFVRDWFKPLAYGVILLHRDGYPCVFYGDYFGVHRDGDMHSHREMLENLMWIRKTFAYGEEELHLDREHCIGWVRFGNESHPGRLAVVLSNQGADSLSMFVGKDQAGKRYKDYTGHVSSTVVIDEEGYGDFMVAERSISCWAEEM